jgi:predicted phosphohydrolase
MNINTKEAVNGSVIKDVVVLEIKEALPPSKKLISDTHDYWIDLIHTAIGQAAFGQKLPYFEKAFVLIEITTQKYTDNTQLWDTSNRSINLVINNLKGIFFKDDNLEHMAFGVVGNWGETSKTVIKIMPFERFVKLIENQ